MRTFARDHKARQCAGAVAAVLAVMMLGHVSPPVVTAQPTQGASLMVQPTTDETGEQTPLAVVPAVVVAAVWLWRARTAAASAKNHVLSLPTMRDTTFGEQAAAFELDLRHLEDRP